MAGRQRERELARVRARREQERAEARAARRRRRLRLGAIGAAALLVAAVVAVAAGSTRSHHAATTLAASPAPSSTAGAAAPSASAGARPSSTPGRCTFTAAPGEATGGRTPGLPASTPAHGSQRAVITTSAGTVVVALRTATAPCTVASFDHLAAVHFFDHTRCHRLTTSGIYVLQCGDPTATGSGGPGYNVPDEIPAGTTYPAGTVAMANAGPGTGGSQFFLVYRTGQLGPSYTPFGTVVSGLSVLQAIARDGVAGGGPDGPPARPVTITRFTIERT